MKTKKDGVKRIEVIVTTQLNGKLVRTKISDAHDIKDFSLSHTKHHLVQHKVKGGHRFIDKGLRSLLLYVKYKALPNDAELGKPKK